MIETEQRNTNLGFDELHALLKSVFALRARERALTFLVDLPDENLPDHARWFDRRQIVQGWYGMFSMNRYTLPFDAIRLCNYKNVGSNNNDLPLFVNIESSSTEDDAHTGSKRILLENVLQESSVVLAITELSATAPLKILAKQLNFRGATLPGFMREMMPSLKLNYENIHERVLQFKSRLDLATQATIQFRADNKEYTLLLDLRYRTAHASGGLIREDGMMANLPSGEAYIVPYEGERNGDPSKTSGSLPVQFDDEIVVYQIEDNRAVEVLSRGNTSEEESKKLQEEPAYGNMAEFGLGILGEWGVSAVGSILLDEKLGLHIAFGRSEHFGGVTGPRSFQNPKNVIHIDRVYVHSSQPRIIIKQVMLSYPNNGKETIMVNGEYVV